MSTPASEPLRAEHRELLPHLAELDHDVHEWTDRTPREVADELGAMVEFLRGHLVPHARAEEEVLYPAVEQAMGAPGATATMVADHREIVTRIDRFATTVDTVTQGWPDPAVVRDVARQLAGMSALIGHHFRKEEEVLLPVLDRSLSSDQAHDLFVRMGHAAHH